MKFTVLKFNNQFGADAGGDVELEHDTDVNEIDWSESGIDLYGRETREGTRFHVLLDAEVIRYIQRHPVKM